MAMQPIAMRGPRSLLRQIREAMAGSAPAQARLDMVVRTIARSMVAEVCSIYLRRGEGDLELFATEGLAAEAVHVTTLKPGEGLKQLSETWQKATRPPARKGERPAASGEARTTRSGVPSRTGPRTGGPKKD